LQTEASSFEVVGEDAPKEDEKREVKNILNVKILDADDVVKL
jgi:hypothetical protein